MIGYEIDGADGVCLRQMGAISALRRSGDMRAVPATFYMHVAGHAVEPNHARCRGQAIASAVVVLDHITRHHLLERQAFVVAAQLFSEGRDRFRAAAEVRVDIGFVLVGVERAHVRLSGSASRRQAPEV